MQTPLLTLQDFRDLLEIPEALELQRLRTHIVETQGQWLEDVLAPWPALYPALAAGVLQQSAPTNNTVPAGPTQALVNDAQDTLQVLAAPGVLAVTEYEIEILGEGEEPSTVLPLAEPLATLWELSRPMLVYAAYASFLPFSTTTLTAHSLVEKLSDESKPVADNSRTKQAAIYIGWAQRKQVKLKQLLQQLGPALNQYGPRPSCSSTDTPTTGTVTWLPIRNNRR